MPQMAWLFSTAHVIRFGRNLGMKPTRQKNRALERATRFEIGRTDWRELPRVDHHDTEPKNSEGSKESSTVNAAMIERGTAAQGVPVRQIRVAELDDDVAVCFFGATRRRRNVIGDFNISHEMASQRCEAKITRARTQLCVATRARYL